MNTLAKTNGLPYAYKPQLVQGDIEEFSVKLFNSPNLSKEALMHELLYEKLHRQRKHVVQKLQQRIDKLEKVEAKS